MSDEQVRYFIVDPRSETHATIERLNAERTAAGKARWDFLHREFPQSKSKDSGWGLSTWESAFGGSYWEITAPDGELVPPDWKVNKRHGSWSPRSSTKRGKALLAEMRSEKYETPGVAQIGEAIGCKAVWVGMSLCTIGIRYANNNHWLLSLMKGHKVPKGCRRISDIEVEKLTAAKKRKRKAAAV